jgi:hypothetical protein
MHSFAAQSKTTQRHWLRANDSWKAPPLDV